MLIAFHRCSDHARLDRQAVEALLDFAWIILRELSVGNLRRAIDEAMEDDAGPEVCESVKVALMARAALETISRRAGDPGLHAALDAIDEELRGKGPALDLLDDDEYLDALHETGSDEGSRPASSVAGDPGHLDVPVETGAPAAPGGSWWRDREAEIRALPMDRLRGMLLRASRGAQEVDDKPPGAQEGDVCFHPEPLRHVDLEDAGQIHMSFLAGLWPSPSVLKKMLRRDMVFGALRGSRPIALVHARILEPGSSLGASDIEERDGCWWTTDAFPPLIAADTFVVCHSAVTHPNHRKAKVTQRLITEAVLPYLSRHPEARRMPWYTSSPCTHFVATGRWLARGPGLIEVLRACDAAIANAMPNGWGSLAAIIEAASPWLSRHGLYDETAPATRSITEAARVFEHIYRTLPTHDELVVLRKSDAEGGSAEARREAAAAQARVDRLYERSRSRRDTAHAASFVLLFLAAACTQAGVHGSRGKPADPILAFHLDNGARLAQNVGPMPNARRSDVAALRFGQVLEYGLDWGEQRRQNRRLFDEQSARAHQGVSVDTAFATKYLESCVARTKDLVRRALEPRALRPVELSRTGTLIAQAA
jgi:hypothetical protein